MKYWPNCKKVTELSRFYFAVFFFFFRKVVNTAKKIMMETWCLIFSKKEISYFIYVIFMNDRWDILRKDRRYFAAPHFSISNPQISDESLLYWKYVKTLDFGKICFYLVTYLQGVKSQWFWKMANFKQIWLIFTNFSMIYYFLLCPK